MMGFNFGGRITLVAGLALLLMATALKLTTPSLKMNQQTSVISKKSDLQR